MRILLAVHALPAAKLGGTELYTQELAETFAGDHTVAVATPRGTETEIDGATVSPLPDPADWTDPTGQESGLVDGVVHEPVDRQFAGLVDTFDPDVVHCQHLKFLSASLPGICAEKGVPCLLTVHDFWTVCHREQLSQPSGARCDGPDSVAKCTACYVDALRRTDGPDVTPKAGDGPVDVTDCWNAVSDRSEELAAAREAADLLVSPSRFLRDRFVAFGTSRDRIVHRRNGIRVDRFVDTGFDPAEPLRIGYAGRITHSKGVHVLLSAFERVEGDAELHVFGRFDPDGDPYHARLHEAAGEAVTFHGRYDAAPTPYERMDVLVVPSLWYENSPLIVQEAFASGVPVVAGDVGGMAELVTDGADGRTFTVGDPDALAEVLGDLVDSPEAVARLRAGVEPPKSLSEHAEELEALYEAARSPEVDLTA